jgi:quercetin dioxygenase-like cupin family protein
MHASDGLFLAASRRIAGRYHGLEYEEVAVDNLAARMIRRPRDFDVLLMPNLYGDIFSDLCAGLVGGLGVAPGANIGEAAAVFEAVHGTAPDIAGQNKANPTATILSGVMLLEHIGEFAAAARVRGALEGVLVEGWAVTRDLGGESTTSGMADAVIKRLAETASQQPNALDAAHRVVDLPRVAALAERAGVVWRAGLAQQQLALHRYEPGGGTTSFINPEADEVLVILEGEGVLEVAGERYSLHPGHVASVPRGARRQVRAGAERLVYVAVRPA